MLVASPPQTHFYDESPFSSDNVLSGPNILCSTPKSTPTPICETHFSSHANFEAQSIFSENCEAQSPALTFASKDIEIDCSANSTKVDNLINQDQSAMNYGNSSPEHICRNDSLFYDVVDDTILSGIQIAMNYAYSSPEPVPNSANRESKGNILFSSFFLFLTVSNK